jgi:disulfide bond formation protein DsbB
MAAPRLRLALVAAALAAAAALAVAFAFEWWGGLVPCALCLLERWPYRVAIALAVIGCVVPARLLRTMLALVLLAGLADVAVAGVHVGVEFGWWPSPLPECMAPHFQAGSSAERLRSMPARPSKPCDEPVYVLDPLPVSFAQLNLLYALAFCGGVAIVLGRGGRKGR